MTVSDFEIAGTRGRIVVHRWDVDAPRFVVLLSHGYGEHARRYDHVAERLNEDGAVVYAPDHWGHGRSDGERALAEDLEGAVSDLHLVAERAAADHPGLPTARSSTRPTTTGTGARTASARWPRTSRAPSPTCTWSPRGRPPTTRTCRSRSSVIRWAG